VAVAGRVELADEARPAVVKAATPRRTLSESLRNELSPPRAV